MAGVIVCPNCSHQFEPTDAFREEVQRELRAEAKKWREEKEEEYKKRELQLQQQLNEKDSEAKKLLEAEKKKLTEELQSSLKQSIAADYENQLKMLQQQTLENEAKLKEARSKELEFLKKEQELKNKEAELELQLQKQLLAERSQITEQVRKEESERSQLKETELQMKMRELEKQLEDQKKLAEEMRRKAEQGSMQLQGEVQELLLEEMLKDHFPYDIIQEVGKGVEGADCSLIVNNRGSECGKIIFESKRTKAFSNGWIEKLKTDMRSQKADVAILVTQVYPKEMSCFGEKDGVWICSFSEVIALTNALRHTIIRVAETRKAEDNKGDKMVMLYDYLTGTEFRQQIETIVEGFMALKQSITKERIQMEKLWKEREKQLDKVLLSTSGMYGSVKGIAGASVQSIPLLEDETHDADDETLILD